MTISLPDHCIDPKCAWCLERKRRRIKQERIAAGLPEEPEKTLEEKRQEWASEDDRNE